MTTQQTPRNDSPAGTPPVQPHVLAMSGYAPGEQPQAGKFIKLNTNECPHPPSEKVIRAIQEAAADHLNLYPDPSGLAFRTVAADLFGVEPDWVICGNGSDDLLTILTRSFIGPGQKLRMMNPSYSLYRTLAEIQNAESDVVNFQPDWSLPDGVLAAPEDVRLIYLPNPNSPSGTIVPKSKIATQLDQLTCPLVVDEAYCDFADENCVDLVKQSANVIVTRTLSKSYGLAGLRFGFAIAQPTVIAELHKVRDSYNCDKLSIAGATAALTDQAWLSENVRQIRATRSRLATELEKLGFHVTPSDANFVWCNHPDRNSRTLYEQLKAQKILIRYMEYADWGDGIRITVGSDSQIDALLAVLKTLV